MFCLSGSTSVHKSSQWWNEKGGRYPEIGFKDFWCSVIPVGAEILFWVNLLNDPLICGTKTVIKPTRCSLFSGWKPYMTGLLRFLGKPGKLLTNFPVMVDTWKMGEKKSRPGKLFLLSLLFFSPWVNTYGLGSLHMLSLQMCHSF